MTEDNEFQKSHDPSALFEYQSKFFEDPFQKSFRFQNYCWIHRKAGGLFRSDCQRHRTHTGSGTQAASNNSKLFLIRSAVSLLQPRSFASR